MCYHSACLARRKELVDHVDVVASKGSAPPESLTSLGEEAVSFVLMSPFPALPSSVAPSIRKVLFLVYAPIKVIVQSFRLLWALTVQARPSTHILVQNPPALPTLALAWIAARLTGAMYIVDWHNLGYTLLALSLSPGHPLVSAYATFERVFGAMAADAHITVTRAMKDHLHGNWGRVPGNVPVSVLHDQPAEAFKQLSVEERKEFLQRFIAEKLQENSADLVSDEQRDILRACSNEADKPLSERSVALVVSSTSWTPDEDFSVLLNALREYDQAFEGGNQVARMKLLVVITGKGPQKEHYRQLIREYALNNVSVVTAWLSLEDYRSILGAADIGVSLHQSSSQLDLPMKVLDMFGSGLPVFARGYPCLEEELVEDGLTGKTFHDSLELTALFKRYCSQEGSQTLANMRDKVIQRRQTIGSWEDEWNRQGLPLFVIAPSSH